MAVASRVSNVIATITCSQCGCDIPISQMGGHNCCAEPPLPQSTPSHPVLQEPMQFRARLPMPEAGIDRSMRPSPLALDKLSKRSATVPLPSVQLQYGPHDAFNDTDGNQAHSTLSHEHHATRYQLPPRSYTSPSLAYSPPSSSGSLQSRSQHYFPLRTSSRPQTPQTASFAVPRNPFEEPDDDDVQHLTSHPSEHTATEPAPLARRDAWDTLPPSRSSPRTSTSSYGTQAQASELVYRDESYRNSSSSFGGAVRKSSSLGSLKDVARWSKSTYKSLDVRQSTSSSVYTRNRSSSMTSRYSRMNLEADAIVPAVPSLPRMSKVSQSHQEEAAPQQSAILVNSQQDRGETNHSSTVHRHRPSPSVTAAMQPLDSIGSASTFKSSRSAKLRGLSINMSPHSSRTIQAVDEEASMNVPPVPLREAQESEISRFSSPRGGSTSSNESYSTGKHTGSSRSSPPLQESPQRRKYELQCQTSPPPAISISSDDQTTTTEDSFNDFRFDVNRTPSPRTPTFSAHGSYQEHPPVSPRFAPFDFSPERKLSPTYTVSPVNPVTSAPAEHIQPTLPVIDMDNYAPRASHTNGRLRSPNSRPQIAPIELNRSGSQATSSLLSPDSILSPMSNPDDYVVSPTGTQYLAHNVNLRVSRAPTPNLLSPASTQNPGHFEQNAEATSDIPVATLSSPTQTRAPANKGPCRGCGELITGKSITSADGRLTGRYHKHCFTCRTCSAPFPTADFYVIDNAPYCSRHYHELNQSLCAGCDRGIEGRYLELEHDSLPSVDERDNSYTASVKFHSYCFTCEECQRILRGEYYEWQGRRLCEQHAFGTSPEPKSALGLSAAADGNIGSRVRHPSTASGISFSLSAYGNTGSGRDASPSGSNLSVSATHTGLDSGDSPQRRYPERRTTRLMTMI